MKVEVILHGGLEILFGGQSQFPVEVSEGATIQSLITEMKTHYLKEREELFISENSVRPGIIVMVNDTDWELLDMGECSLKEGDKVCFISTLHGG